MDLYEEKEHIISSDEYSDDDDDDDALMNDAIRAQHPCREFLAQNNQPLKWQIEQQKQKQLSSLIRKNKISIIYKNKSIKWLNNKKQRERYKEHIYGNTLKQIISENLCNVKEPILEKEPQFIKHDTSNSFKLKSDSIKVDKVVSIDDDDIFDEVQSVTIEKNVLQKKIQESTLEKPEYITPKSAEFGNKMNLNNNKDVFESKNVIQQKESGLEEFKKINDKLTEKRARSSSPPILNDNEVTSNETKKYRTESPQFYKKINEMYPKFDEIARNHIDSMTNSTLIATEDKMKNILNEIQTLNEILRTKEMEWNRLLHLKMIKEEICSRLSQKKHLLLLKENYAKTRDQNTLADLKDLELYLSEKNTVSSETNLSSTSIQQLIENRANMNAEDLEREKSSTSRLHSLLVSRNMLHGIDSSQNRLFSNGDKNIMAKTNKNSETYQNFDSRSVLNNRGRQGEFKDVKSIIADFRQKNPEHIPRVGKRIKSSELNSQIRNISIPFFEKTPRSQYLHFPKDHQSKFYPSRNCVEEISITPIGGSAKKLASSQNDFVNAMNSPYNVCLDGNFIKADVKRDFEARSPNKNLQYPVCQECKTHESRFVCAGCGNQWYCSKKCQISAWDKHSEICTD